MNKNPLQKTVAVCLIVALVAPATFFIAPQKASAAAVSCLGGLLGVGIGGAVGGAIEVTLAVPTFDATTATGATFTAGATASSCINDLILIPLARAFMRHLIQKMTASVINWINDTPGRDGNRQPSYVQNLPNHLQRLSDGVALSFLVQLGSQPNSPFGLAISSSLRTNYLQRTSSNGFFAANQNTLSQSSPDVNAYLAGDWSKGGIRTWFALTTETQNNPYTLYQSARGQLAGSVGQAQTDRRQDLLQSGGFLSWCGGGGSTNSASISPQDACRNKDGSTASVVTPGSVIHDYGQKVFGVGFDQLVAADDLDSALGAIVEALVNRVIGGVNGLFGASNSGSPSTSFTRQLQDYSASSGTVNQATSQMVQTILTQIGYYETAWQTIGSSAYTASANIETLKNACPTQSTVAQEVFTTQISPVITQAQTAQTTVDETRALALKVQGESPVVSADVSMLVTTAPSSTEISNAQQNAQVLDTAVATPEGSLSVSGGTLVDRMNLLATNATTIQSNNCTILSPDVIDIPAGNF